MTTLWDDFKSQFAIPRAGVGADGIYLCSHSLGLMPRSVRSAMIDQLDVWASMGVDGHFRAVDPWIDFNLNCSATLAKWANCKPAEIIVMNSLTVNLQLALASFYQPRYNRCKVLIESSAFPSDEIAICSHLMVRGVDPHAHLLNADCDPETHWVDVDRLLTTIEDHKEDLACVILPMVKHDTGQLLPVQAIGQLCRQYGIIFGLDLAHALGSVPVDLAKIDSDFAVFCTYKYLCAGPGAVGGLYVNQRNFSASVPRLGGWFGQPSSIRFNVNERFRPIEDASGWQVSNPPIFSVAPLKAALAIFEKVSRADYFQQIAILRRHLQIALQNNLPDKLALLGENSVEGGAAMVCLQARSQGAAEMAIKELTRSGIICDRRHRTLRLSVMPLYNSIEDIDALITVLRGG